MGACWSPTRWLGEGSTVRANAERVKDAAEAYRYGYPWCGGRDGMTLVAALTGVFSTVRRDPGEVGKGNHFAAWQEPNFFTTKAEPYSGHCADRRPTNNGGRHEQHRRVR